MLEREDFHKRLVNQQPISSTNSLPMLVGTIPWCSKPTSIGATDKNSIADGP